jgi:hypothetical protein
MILKLPKYGRKHLELNAMTMQEALTPPPAFTPQTFVPIAYKNNAPNFAHFASPMIHLTTGETISSYKRLMNDPETAEIWQTAFGKDFGRMAQGDNKTGKKGSHIEETHRHALPISPLQNCYETVWSSAQKAHVLCASILKTSTSRQPWIIMNT